MSDEPLFNLESDPLLIEQELASAMLSPTQPVEVETAEKPSDEEHAAAAPVVVVQYRNRGVPPILLFPITLVLSLGMFAAYHYLFVAPRQRELQERALAQAEKISTALIAGNATSPEPVESVPDLPAMDPGLTLGGQPLPPDPPKLPPPPFSQSAPSPSLAASPAPAGPEPAAAKSVAAPVASSPSPPPAAASGAEDKRVAAKPVAPDQEESIWAGLNDEPPLAVAKAAPTTPQDPAPSPKAEPTAPASALSEPRKNAPAIGFAPPGAPASFDPAGALAMAPADVIAPAGKPGKEPVGAFADDTDVRKPPTAEEMQAALEREAEANRAARTEQDKLKETARAQVEQEAQARVENERQMFRDELKRLVDASGSSTGDEIDELCDRYGRNYDRDLKAQVMGVLSRYHGRLSAEGEVRLLRSLGVPEAGILDFLSNNMHRSINSRNGPRDPNEVRVRAARQLLRMKLTAGAPPLPAGPSRSRQSSAARGFSAGPAR